MDDPQRQPDPLRSAITLPLGGNRSPRTDGRKALLFFALFWCTITGVFVGFVVWAVWHHIDAQRRFESTPGVVLSSRVESSSDSDGTTYSAALRYQYSVAGQDYVSSRYSFGDMGSSGGGYARSVVAGHPPGKRVTVYYDPDKPSEAVLAVEIPPMMWFMSLFLQPFILIGVGLTAAIVVGAVRRWRIRAFLAQPLQPPCNVPTWGRLEMGRDGFTVRCGPPVSKLLMIFAGGYGMACFLSIFVVAFAAGGFEGDPMAVKVALVVAAGVGVVSAVWSVVKGGDGALQVNDGAGRLTIARQKGAVDLAIAEIDHWTVRSVPSKWRNKNGPTSMEPQLTAVTTDAREVAVRQFPGSDDESFALACTVGEWLAGVTRKPFKAERA